MVYTIRDMRRLAAVRAFRMRQDGSLPFSTTIATGGIIASGFWERYLGIFVPACEKFAPFNFCHVANTSGQDMMLRLGSASFPVPAGAMVTIDDNWFRTIRLTNQIALATDAPIYIVWQRQPITVDQYIREQPMDKAPSFLDLLGIGRLFK